MRLFPTQCGPSILELIFLKSKTYAEDTNLFFIQNQLHWYTYRLLHGRAVYVNMPKITLFGSSLIYQLRLLRSKKHLQSGELLKLFSTLGTENILAEVDLENTGVD
jgi:hypothetical protein